MVFYDHIISSAGDFNLRDQIVAGIAVLILIEATRRTVGMPLVILMLAAMFYAFAGPWLPGGLHHAGFSIERIVSQEYLGTEGIFGSDPMKTGLTATRLAISAYLVPFIFALSPALLLVDAPITSIIEVIPSAIIGIVGLSAAAMGYWRRQIPMWQRAVLLVGALGLLTPGIATDIAGLAALGLVWFLQRKEDPKAALASHAASTNEIVRK